MREVRKEEIGVTIEDNGNKHTWSRS